MKKVYTFLLAGAVFLAGVMLCFALGNIDAGEHILVQREDASPPTRGGMPSTEGYLELLPGETVNINTADFEVLEKLPEIGEVIARRIIEYRTENGPFRSIEELTEIEDIGPRRFEEIRALIVTGYE